VVNEVAAVERMRTLLEAAAAELEARREDVLSSTLIWPRGLDAERCAAFLHAVDRELAVLDSAGYVTVPRSGRFPLLSKAGIGIEVDLQRVSQVGSLAG
jgi:hypothetical protein